MKQGKKEEKNASKNGDIRKKPRGAPVGHPPWTRDVPENIDRIVEVDAPENCPCCGEPTDLTRQDQLRFVQEDIVLCPKRVATEYRHGTAGCPGCQKDVRREDGGILLDAPIGLNAKAAALYLRHELHLPLRKITAMMSTLFGIDFVPASLQRFKKKARRNGDEVYGDLVKMLRNTDCIHADETYWREDEKTRHRFRPILQKHPTPVWTGLPNGNPRRTTGTQPTRNPAAAFTGSSLRITFGSPEGRNAEKTLPSGTLILFPFPQLVNTFRHI